MRFHRQKFISFWQNNRLNFVKLEQIMFILIYRAGLNPVFTIKIVLKWPNNHFNSILLIWQCSICAEIHWKYFERHNLRIFYLTRDTCIWKGSEKKLKLETFEFECSKWNWKFRVQVGNTAFKTFQLRSELSNEMKFPMQTFYFQTFQFWAFQLLFFSNRTFQLHVSEYFIGVQD